VNTVDPLLVSSLFTVVVLVGAGFGARARRWVPAHHQDADTREVVKIGVGFLGTLAALVLGLVVASAKASFDTKTAEVQTAAAKVLQLDRSLKRVGADAAPARAALRQLVASRIGHLGGNGAGSAAAPAASGLVAIENMLHGLQPKDEAQRQALAQAQLLTNDLQRLMADAFTQAGSSITTPLLVLLLFWFAVILAGWNFIAPVNGTTLLVNVLCALSIAGAIFMLLQMDQPFGGVIRVSDAPLRAVLPQLAQ
jgi:hypothetical protein